jgi:mono/diheme cytochrome c family protein
MRITLASRKLLSLAAPFLALGLGWGWWTEGSLCGQPASRQLEFASRHYRRLCARCHGNDYQGNGRRDWGIPDFTRGSFHQDRTDTELLVSILQGKGRHMPAFIDQLSQEQARALVHLIRDVNPTPSAPAATSPAEFARRFQALQRELDDLRKQFRDLENTSHPATRQAE